MKHKQTKQTKKDEQDNIIEPSAFLQIGELKLECNRINIIELCNLAVWLLQQEPVKQYLDFIKTKKMAGNYTG